MSPTPVEPWAVIRLDDVRGRCPKQDRVCDILEDHGIPIHLEVIPGDLAETGAKELQQECNRRAVPVLCHQHGFRHANHGTGNKKCEFGDHRGYEAQLEDLVTGKSMMENLLGDLFDPFFSPPWDRYGETTLKAIEAAGLDGMSVLWKEGSPDHPNLPIIRFTLDPVNWKPTIQHQSWHETLTSLLASIENNNFAGLQLHHEVMEESDFVGLDETLGKLSDAGIQWPTMKDLAMKGTDS